ncbi:transposase [Streptomyces zhihengii]|uniref:transposase n=1 Tax=Streptomyces zhihengii TaxID=1818004 RepID=UPI001FD60425
MLEYKAAPYGRAFHRIGRFEPTSQICSACGVKAGPKPLHTQVWTCRACGTGTSRDQQRRQGRRTARISLRSAGKTRTIPAQRVETGTHPKPRPVTTGRQTGILAPWDEEKFKAGDVP